MGSGREWTVGDESTRLLSLTRQTLVSRSALLLIGFIACLPAPSAMAAEILSVGDGDTVAVQDNGKRVKVRLACIDAPETRQRPYGTTSRTKLRSLLPIGAQVSLKTKAVDRYGRTVAELFRNGQNINQRMVRDGQAFVYWQYIQGCDRQTYGAMETRARQDRLGVWVVPGGIQRPWDYRRNRRSGPSSSGTTKRRWRCSQVGSWQRAQELLRQGHTYLDGDRDGEACEGLR